LPHTEKEQRELAEKSGKLFEDVRVKVESLHEFNPMMGHRGCRLGIVFPEITRMQAKAIFAAAVEVKKQGIDVHPEVMIPLVGSYKELENQAKVVREAARTVSEESGVSFPYSIGTMIEIPRAAITADEIAKTADFFSFGTNDLTQMTFGLSRDDSGKFLPYYVNHEILPNDPFVTIDSGVSELVKIAVEKGRTVKANLKIGICGEHGGDPQTISFCNSAGLNYVSCSPFRLPIARLAAAQAAIRSDSKRPAKRIKRKSMTKGKKRRK
jgi:pyruvate,orthophosphate dikinase